MRMDLIKHLSVFDPSQFEHMTILVIGAGAVGSSVVLGLTKLGLTNICVMDDDVVEPHNLPNQYVYGPDDVGMPKVSALAAKVEMLALGGKVGGYWSLPERYTHGKVQADVVFMCVDSMKARKLIVDKGLYINPKVKWAFDTRIDAYQGMSYAFEPRDFGQLAAFKETLYDDDAVEPTRGTCGTILSIGATAQIASQQTIWLFIQALTNKLTANEVITDTASWKMLSRKF